MRRRSLTIMVAAQLLVWAEPAISAEGTFDTDRLFSFNLGSDTGEAGQKQIQVSLAGALGRASGSYAALIAESGFQYSPTENSQLAFSTEADAHKIDNITGMDNRRSLAFGGLTAGFGYRLLDRAVQGIGFALYANAEWTRADEDTGSLTTGYGGEFIIAVDRELVAGNVVGVVNLVYRPATLRSADGPGWLTDTTAGLSAGLSVKLAENLFGGLEAQYLRKYDGLDFRAYSGDAFFVGPSISFNLSEHSWISGGWNIQMFGRAPGIDGALNLTDFSHHLIRLGWGLEF